SNEQSSLSYIQKAGFNQVAFLTTAAIDVETSLFDFHFFSGQRDDSLDHEFMMILSQHDVAAFWNLQAIGLLVDDEQTAGSKVWEHALSRDQRQFISRPQTHQSTKCPKENNQRYSIREIF